MAATLAEPAVLAAAKETLYPDPNTNPNQYAVTETQFTTTTWGTWTIPDNVRRRLEPYNTIRLTSGEPDLLGVGMPSEGVLNANVTATPVTVIEAKGHNTIPSKADVHTGITQAHGHLSEVNLGYVAAPLGSITDQARTLARELNIGIVGVDNTQTGTLVEPARVTGAGDFSTTIDAIRFQATTHQLTDGSFPVNHPKNYLGYALALAADGDTDEVYSEYVINSVSGGRRGALLLGLVDNRPSGRPSRISAQRSSVLPATNMEVLALHSRNSHPGKADRPRLLTSLHAGHSSHGQSRSSTTQLNSSSKLSNVFTNVVSDPQLSTMSS